VEQQLKLHIEVLQEKIDDLEKEKKDWEAKSLKEKAQLEKKLKHSFQKLMEQKQLELSKVQDSLKRQQELFNGSFERSRVCQGSASSNPGHATQVKVVRVNNFVGGDSSSKSKGRDNAQSHSPSGLHAGTGKQAIMTGGKVKKGLKVINNSSKSPYLNNVFTKNGINQQSTTTHQTATDTSSQSSAKANRKGAASAEISDSSLNVLKKINKSQV